MSSSHAEHISVKTYVAIFLALLGLLVATVWAGFIDLGNWNLVLAMAIATTKAVLIVVYFMHLKVSSRLISGFFLASIFILFLGVILLFCDYIVRL